MKTPCGTTHGTRILLVDDEPQNRALLEVMLKLEGVVFTQAGSGAEALASVAAEPPDLILLDVMMPGMDGNEVAHQLKGDPATQQIPIIMITSLDDRSARMLALSAGAEDFLSKPVDRAELSVRVRNLLRLKAYSDEHESYNQMLEFEVGRRTADLGESESLYRSTFDAAPVGIAHVGLEGQWLRVNRRLCELLGYTAEELLSGPVQAAMGAEQAPGEADDFRRLAAGALTRDVIDERRYPRRDGTFLWARVNRSIHRDVEGRPLHCISVIEDITAQRALAAQLRQASKMDAVGRLASGIAHDFNNLLSIILTYSQTLSVDLRADDPIRADLAEIHAAGLRAAELTHQLLAFSRQQVLKPTVVDLAAIVGGMNKLLRRLIGEDVELIATPPATPGAIRVDRGQLEQVIMNLAVNARDAMPKGGTLSLETSTIVLDEAYAAEHDGVKAGPHVMLLVRDTGCGMDPATQAHMFDPFFTTKEVGKGTGLGLATVFGIVHQSGGTTWVDSELGKGTTFKILFPRVADEALPLPTPPLDGAVPRGTETILLVEDEEAVRAVAATVLRKCGYAVLEAQNAGDALLLCEQHPEAIDLLLTDVVMPRLSGRQLAERLRVVRPAMKVLYMSGYPNDSVLRAGIETSRVSFLQKPLTPEMLARKVREVLDGSEASAGVATLVD